MKGRRRRSGRWLVGVVAAAFAVVSAEHGARGEDELVPAAAMPSAGPTAPEPTRAEAPSPAAARATTARARAERGYAQRETRNPQTASFRGGDSVGIYIGGSAGVLLVLLIVILLLR